ncbi:hypothetical protein GCM10027290_29910 [Micromonospora sonneratiae]
MGAFGGLQLRGEDSDDGALAAVAVGVRWLADGPWACRVARVLDAGTHGFVAVEEVQRQSAFAVHGAEGDRLPVTQHAPDGFLGVLLGALGAGFGGGREPVDALLAVG